jgi:hypothetical protein
MFDEEEVLQRFDFHAATEVTKPQHKAIRAEYKALAQIILDSVPDSRERSLALTALHDSMVWCNAAIAYR